MDGKTQREKQVGGKTELDGQIVRLHELHKIHPEYKTEKR